MMKYNVVIVGAGLAGCVAANLLSKEKRVLMVEQRDHIGGNCYDYYNEYGILIHKYGPHFFHTNDCEVVNYLSNFTPWHYYQHRVLVYMHGQYIKFPINATKECFTGYTNKQWGKWASKIDKSVQKRVEKFNDFDDRYFNDKYQMMPKFGYTYMIKNMINHKNISILLKTKWKDVANELQYDFLIYTGCIDEFFNFRCGRLPYRSLRFEFETLDCEYYQSSAQINYSVDYDFTRIIEIKHATGQKHLKTTIVREYPEECGIPYYPIPCKETKSIYKNYLLLSKKQNNIIFIGRLAKYKYLNMDQVIKEVFGLQERMLKN